MRRGAVLGRFCHGCGSVYPLYRSTHSADPLYGKDHVVAPCPYEGAAFGARADWWEPAVEVLPPPAAAVDGGG